MDLEVVSVEGWAVLSAADLRANLRRSSASEDALLEGFIAAATRHAEKKTRTSILGRTLRLFLPAWPRSYVELPAPPLRYAIDDGPEAAITVKYRDADGVLQPASMGVLVLVKGDQVWRLERGSSGAPELQDVSRAVQIEFSVGYASADAVPEDIRDAIMLLASHRDQNREATLIEGKTTLQSHKIEFGVDALLASHVVMTRYTPMWV